MRPIYLDYNATTPIAPEVADAMRPYLEQHFGNPSSSHWFGQQTRKALIEARIQVAKLLGAKPEQIVFTSGGSESNNMAIQGYALAARSRGNHIITSTVEHPAVLEVCRHLEQNGFRITRIPVNERGRVELQALIDSISEETILITIMHANNEVGTIQPISEIARIAHEHGIALHTDAAQSVGKIPVQVDELGVDLLSVAGHKFYAPKGVGALYIRPGTRLEKLIYGADHEQNRRAGTENVLEIAGLGAAAVSSTQKLNSAMPKLAHLRDRLQNLLLEGWPDAQVNGDTDHRLPNTLSISFPHIEANTLLDEIAADVAASAGAACHTDQVDVSTVLEAMRLPVHLAMGTIRFSVGRMTTTAEIDRAAESVLQALARLRPNRDDIPLMVDTPDQIRLTQYTHGLGCACKLRPQDLEQVLKQMPVVHHPDVLVGTDSSDDAAVYRLRDDLALVQTVDFFTPIVDDPELFGAIAAANSLSDIYAMGATPVFALNVVGFPDRRLPMDVLQQILTGAAKKAEEAGISILGGHTIEDPEPKYGMVVSGTVHPDRLLTNNGARPGDQLVLTKAIGTGIISTAMKRGVATNESRSAAIQSMLELNRSAAEALEGLRVSACTDVTGFGLLGHLKELTTGSGMDARIVASSVPELPGVRDLLTADVVPGGTLNNLDFVSPFVAWHDSLSRNDRLVLCDAQTSGGLLIAVHPNDLEPLRSRLQQAGVLNAHIGELTAKGRGEIVVAM